MQVLEFQQPIPYLSTMMFVHQCKNADHRTTRDFPSFFCEKLSDNLPDRLAACGKAVPAAMTVEFPEQLPALWIQKTS